MLLILHSGSVGFGFPHDLQHASERGRTLIRLSPQVSPIYMLIFIDDADKYEDEDDEGNKDSNANEGGEDS